MTSRIGLALIVLFVVAATVLSVVAVSASFGPGMDLPYVFHVAGRFLGIFAYIILAMQYVWTAKTKAIEKLLPYDQRVAVHRTFGFLGITTVTLHPILVLAAFASWGVGFTLSTPILLGFIALVILLLVAASTFLGRIWGVRYEVWKTIHWITFGVLTLAFAHSMLIGSDIQGYYRWFWIALYALHVLIVVSKLIHKAVAWTRRYPITSIEVSGPNVRTIRFDTPRKTHHPGQFTFISLNTGGKWSHWHPFSITSTAADGTLSVAVKEAGDFTGSLGSLRPGDMAKVDPGYGGFSPVFAPDDRYIMVAGGIGIAPIYGILKHLRAQDNPPEVVLLYTVHHESDIVFRNDLDTWFSEIPNWKLNYIVTSQPDWEGERGRLTPDRAVTLCGSNLDGTFFLCGPSQMVRSLRRHLRAMGVHKRKIRHELFEFLP